MEFRQPQTHKGFIRFMCNDLGIAANHRSATAMPGRLFHYGMLTMAQLHPRRSWVLFPSASVTEIP